MESFVIVFRGVGGATQLPVKRLKECLTDAGFKKVATYINSGNAVLASDLPRQAIVKRVAEICERKLDFTKAVYAVSREEWAAIIAKNPFPEAVAAPTTLHAAVLASAPDPARIAALNALGGGTDHILVIDQIAYLHTPNGFGRSKLAERFDKDIGVANTARNWNTVLKLMELVNVAAL